MPPTYKNATEEQFQQWEKLVDGGMPPYYAAMEVGTSLGGLKRGDQERKDRVMALAKERQAALVERRTEALVASPDPPQGIFTAYQKANHEAYRDKQQIELSGTIQHEAKVIPFGALIELASELGIIDQLGLADRSRAGLPAAREILPPPSE